MQRRRIAVGFSGKQGLAGLAGTGMVSTLVVQRAEAESQSFTLGCHVAPLRGAEKELARSRCGVFCEMESRMP